MTDGRFDEEAVFNAARGIADPRERAVYLQQVCPDRPSRARIEALLSVHEQQPNFLNSPVDVPAPTTSEVPVEEPGTIIGPYKLREQIGEGGFGVVYVADQTEPVRRRVALKIIKPGMDTRDCLARFEAERQALALMDHLNIARVLDAGATDTGRPYFAMELVQGIPITEFCDQQKLAMRERLALFVDVCRAVQHAHQKGIIHRDLKPTNVMVTMHDDRPVVKVIDFGVAKAIGHKLSEQTVYTAYGQMIGTPMYMSPEQAQLSGLDVDTRSDVYSLGVLLYELLTGTTPFDKETLKKVGFDEMRRMIREDEPPRPSTRISTLEAGLRSTVADRRKVDPRQLSESLRGELDWIVMKCLEKDRRRRYESASALAADAERYLRDEPVQACPPSRAYRFRKFARRNQRSLAIIALLTVVLFGAVGAVTATIGWAVRDRQERQRDLESRVIDALDDAASALQSSRRQEAASATHRAKDLLSGTMDHPQLAGRLQELEADLAMLDELEVVVLQKTDFETGKFTLARAEPEYARAFLEFGIDIDSLPVHKAAERIRSRSICIELAAALDDWALVRRNVLKTESAKWKRLFEISRAADPDPFRVQLRDALASEDSHRGKRLAALRELAESEKVNTLARPTLTQLGLALNSLDDNGAAIQLLQGAQRLHPDDFWINYALGYCLSVAGIDQEALAYFIVAVTARPQSALARANVGHVFLRLERLDEAIAEYRAAMAVKPDFTMGMYYLGMALIRKVDAVSTPAQRRALLDEAIALQREAIRLEPSYANSRLPLGKALERIGDVDGAVESFRQLCRLDESTWPWQYLGWVLYRAGNWQASIEALDKSCRLQDNGEGDCGQWIVMAMAHWQLANQSELPEDRRKEHQQAARLWYDKAVSQIDLNPNVHPEIRDFRTEAAELFGSPAPTGPAHEAFGRAQAAAEKQQWDEAAGEYANVLAWLPDYDHPPSPRSRALSAIAEREELMNRVAQLRPDDKDLRLVGSARAAVARGDWDRAVADYEQLLSITEGANAHAALCREIAASDELFTRLVRERPETAALWIGRGEFFALVGEWNQAADALTRAVALSRPGRVWFAYSLSHLMAGGQDGYRQTCARLLDRFGDTEDPEVADLLAWSCSIAPGGVSDPQQVVMLAERGVAERPEYHLYNLSTALYRAARYEEAAAKLDETMSVRGGGGVVNDWLFLAMTHHHLGHAQEARQWLAKATQWLDEDERANPEPSWKRLDLQLLREEAQTLLTTGKQIDRVPATNVP